MKKIFLMLLATVSLVACDKGGEDSPPKSIIVPNEQQLIQTVYADDNTGTSDISFTTTGAWISGIIETTKVRSTGPGQTAPDWISISPSSGDAAGSYTIAITMNSNYIGSDRSAVIKVLCDGQEILMLITQKGTTADGSKPEKPVLSKVVSKINGETVTYQTGLAIYKLGDVEYLTKNYSNTQWAYVYPNTIGGNCDFSYDELGLSSVRCDEHRWCYLKWAGDDGLYIYGDQRGVSREGHLHTYAHYGDINYTLGNIDINWLLAADEYYTGLPISAVGVRTFSKTRLLSDKVQEDRGSGKYSAEITYKYEFDQQGYITKIYENSTLSGERLIYEFEYTEK